MADLDRTILIPLKSVIDMIFLMEADKRDYIVASCRNHEDAVLSEKTSFQCT